MFTRPNYQGFQVLHVHIIPGRGTCTTTSAQPSQKSSMHGGQFLKLGRYYRQLFTTQCRNPTTNSYIVQASWWKLVQVWTQRIINKDPSILYIMTDPLYNSTIYVESVAWSTQLPFMIKSPTAAPTLVDRGTKIFSWGSFVPFCRYYSPYTHGVWFTGKMFQHGHSSNLYYTV
jgi:hypothetical protein